MNNKHVARAVSQAKEEVRRMPRRALVMKVAVVAALEVVMLLSQNKKKKQK